jgi:hypothetical protein
MAEAAREREDFSHPEKVYKDLFPLINGPLLPEIKEKRKGLRRAGNVHDIDIENEEL